MTCVNVGSSNPDIGGIGIIIAFALQALVSIMLSLWSFIYSGRLETEKHPEEQREQVRKKRYKIDSILLFASDTQTLNGTRVGMQENLTLIPLAGIALLISGLSQVKGLDFYHLHILYDTVNFTSISNCAAIVCSFRTHKTHRPTRFALISCFVVLYLAFTIEFGIRLKQWDDKKPGHCYRASGISRPSAKHPYVDHVYLGITCFFLIGVLEWALIGAFDILPDILSSFRSPPESSSRHSRNENSTQARHSSTDLFSSNLVLIYAFLQFPLHLYSVIALKVTNQSFLEGDSENAWGFGQVVAMVLFGATLIECWKVYQEWDE